jgi:chemotaxis protein MotA
MVVGMMIIAVFLGGGSYASFWDNSSILMVLGGTFGALCACMPLAQLLRGPTVAKKLVYPQMPDFRGIIAQLVELAALARREGVLALETRLDEIEHPFIRMGVRLMVDGSKPEAIEDIMRTEIDSMSLRHREGKYIFDQVGRFAPAFGMIGTLVGLIMMLGQMSDPSRIGTGMAVALITTLYGVVLSNASFLPMADKLSILSRQEVIAREMIVRGIMAIQAGEAPRMIEYKLNTFLAPSERRLAA